MSDYSQHVLHDPRTREINTAMERERDQKGAEKQKNISALADRPASRDAPTPPAPPMPMPDFSDRPPPPPPPPPDVDKSGPDLDR